MDLEATRCAAGHFGRESPRRIGRRPCGPLLESDIAEIERRLLYRLNAPKRIAKDLGVHINTVTTINLGRHPVQIRLRQLRTTRRHRSVSLEEIRT
jgi:hypothetical protein